MTLLTGANQAIAVSGPSERRNVLSLYLELAKARLSALVVLTTVFGYLMATPAGAVFSWGRFLATIVGTALAAACANALNQIVEARRDGLMERTRDRPLPSRSMGPRHAMTFAVVTGYLGLGILLILVSPDAAALALLTILLYILAYTPLKTRSPLNTLVGAVCGAIPPMIGWEAAAGTLGPGAWILAGVLFAWQLPHFFALAWRYRDDYARGGFAMLSVRDPSGRRTALAAALASVALVPLALAATWWDLTGWLYGAGSLVLGTGLVVLAATLCARRTQQRARRLFVATLIYLPLLLSLMALDRVPPGLAGP